MTPYKLKIITPDKSFFDGETTQIIVRTTEGDVGILAKHSDYVANLVPGTFKVKTENGEFRSAAVSDGVIFVFGGEVTVLVSSAEWSDEIDLNRAESAKERAEEKLHDSNASPDDVERARVKLQRALTRISVYNSSHNGGHR